MTEILAMQPQREHYPVLLCAFMPQVQVNSQSGIGKGMACSNEAESKHANCEQNFHTRLVVARVKHDCHQRC